MATLPNWVAEALHARRVRVQYLGRGSKGRAKVEGVTFEPSGYYYYVGTQTRVDDGVYGAFKTRSAAMLDAVARYGLTEADRRRRNVVPLRRRAA